MPRAKSPEVGSHRIDSDGASLHYTRTGHGPALLLIPGGGGDGARYGGVADALADRFTVLSMDRRCCGQSGGDRAQAFDIARQVRDAAAVIRAEATSAHVFGNSGGGVIALKLAEDMPDLVDKAVVHEPPVLAVLEDGAHWMAQTDRIEATYRSAGAMAAMMAFIGHIDGLNGPPPGPPPDPRPDPADIDYFLDKELRHICRVVPDLELLRAAGTPVALAGGAASGDMYYVRAARIIAAALHAPYVEFDGHHFAHAADPARYAQDIAMAFAAL